MASLGQEQGGTIYDQIVTGAIADGTSGNTDSGNSFVIMKKNEVVTIRVTCSEKTSEEAEMTDETGENEGDAQTETSVENTETTSSVITSGQGQNQESEEDQNEEQAQEENENSEQAEE